MLDLLPIGRTRVAITTGGVEHETTWREFCDDNADAFTTGERLAIAVAVAAGDTYRGGGGAEGEWSVRRAS